MTRPAITVTAQSPDGVRAARDYPTVAGLARHVSDLLDETGAWFAVVTDVVAADAWVIGRDGTRYGPVAVTYDAAWAAPSEETAPAPARCRGHLRLVEGSVS